MPAMLRETSLQPSRAPQITVEYVGMHDFGTVQHAKTSQAALQGIVLGLLSVPKPRKTRRSVSFYNPYSTYQSLTICL